MGRLLSTVWLQPATPAAPATAASAPGCAGCLPSAAGPACRSGVTGEPCLRPELAGDRNTLERVMSALNAEVTVDDAGLVDHHWVKALRIADGEAELRLTFPFSCGGGKELAESAFATLRRLLPDTDVYVLGAR